MGSRASISRFDTDPKVGEDARKIMLDEIVDFYVDLAYSGLSTEIAKRMAGWLDHMVAHYNEIEPILTMIALSPHHSLSRMRVKKPISEVESLDPAVIESIVGEFKWLVPATSGEGPALIELLGGMPIRVSVEEKAFDYDVFENRLVKSHLTALASRLGELSETSMELDGYLRRSMKRSEGEGTVGAAEAFLANRGMTRGIEELKGKIDKRLNDPTMAFLGQLARDREPPTQTQIPISHPHYSRFFSSIESYEKSVPPPLILPGKAISQALANGDLYARWCEVKIVEALGEIGYGVKEEKVVGLEGDEMRFDETGDILLAGRGSVAKVALEKIYRNEPPYGSYSTPRKAAMALEVFGGDAVPTVIVFEPRYDHYYSEEKFDTDLERLHMLHDSIVDLRTDEREGVVVGAFVLHPAKMEPIRYKDLAAISLVPGSRISGLVGVLDEAIARANRRADRS
jgi:hypothetical protein